MFILGDILIVIANVAKLLFDFYQMVVIASVIISWLRPRADSEIIVQIIRIVQSLTEPVFFHVRRRLPPAWFRSGLDFTPMIVLVVLYAARMLVVSILMDIGLRLTTGKMPLK